ncbi:MAG: Lysophospholipid acyltransferase [Burkholderiaceae bacterium]|jgi:predicted LPLAT superfamily acyltransferase|nr:MAG: Lysophospholipid acyltransferase [Burkholderiaceae bacterium]
MSAAHGTPEWMRRAERGSQFWLRVMSRLSLALGRRVSRIVLYGIALYFLFAAPAARRASRRYLARCLGREPSWIDQYRHMLAFASTIHDRIYLLCDRHDLFDIRSSGLEPLSRLNGEEHRGCLLFGAHLGSFEVLRAVAREDRRIRVSLAMYPDNAARINQTLAAINPRARPDIIALGRAESILAVHHRLVEGTMVGILADRALRSDQDQEVDFLGAPARFPLGPFRLAAMLRQPAYFMAGLYRGGRRYEVHFELLADPSLPKTEPDREAQAQALLQRYVAALERHCRAAPYNWFNFYDFWGDLGR